MDACSDWVYLSMKMADSNIACANQLFLINSGVEVY